jgi:hypothetical protein
MLLFCACLAGQPDGRVVRNLVVTPTGEGQDVTIRIRNEYSSPATAWILQCETPQGGSRYYRHDQDLSLQTAPIAPGKEIEFKFPTPPPQMRQQMADNGTCADFHSIGAVFADGTVSGDLRWINAVVADRREAFQDIAKATGILKDAIPSGTDTEAVIQQLTDWLKGLTPSGMPTKPLATRGPSWGYTSRGTEPPRMRLSRSPVPAAALWLVSTQEMKLPDAVKALSEWSDRLAKLPGVTETGAPSPARMLTSGPFTPPSAPDLVGKPAPAFTLKDVDGREIAWRACAANPSFWTSGPRGASPVANRCLISSRCTIGSRRKA